MCGNKIPLSVELMVHCMAESGQDRIESSSVYEDILVDNGRLIKTPSLIKYVEIERPIKKTEQLRHAEYTR